jgi:hypothetical protein
MTPDPPEWDDYGERVVATDACGYCGEELDQWEILIDTESGRCRPVLLWKHHSDGAVMCGPTQATARRAGSA